MGLTVKDFAKTLKIKDDALLERMKAAGLSHSKASDEITPADKLAILKSLKERIASFIWSSLFCCCSFKFSAAACLLASILSVRPSDELGVEEVGWESVPFDLTVTPPLLEEDVTEADIIMKARESWFN